MTEKKNLTFEEINKIDVSKHIEQKMGLSYLSWAWAHAEIKKIDEKATITIHEFPEYVQVADSVQTLNKPFLRDEGGAWVKVSVELNNRTETEWLPVMDMRNKAMTNPDAMAINKAHKRCFVKALALHGLGLYVYAGEDLPEVDPPKPATALQRKTLIKLIEDLAPHIGKAYEQTEAVIMAKSDVKGRFDGINNEDYGKMLNYVKELIDYYEKNPTKSKIKKEEPKKATKKEKTTEIVGLNLEYPQAEK